ncbi:MAG: hypothetical protein H0U84_04875 [Thermoleophilaceae bacterium]|nr:hypothetical protein [Thermoleophilaceae bacterium]
MENSAREEREQIDRPDQTTSPDEPTHEATTPPGKGDRDEKAIEEAENQLNEAGGGH